MQTVNIFWFRRDLRLQDNAGLYHALKSCNPVVPIFIFDTNILDKLEDRADRRVEFIHAALEEIQSQLIQLGSSLGVYHGTPLSVYKTLLSKYKIEKVFTNHDYEPYASEREKLIAEKNFETQQASYSNAVCWSLLVFYVFAMQCMSTMAVVRRETGNWKWPFFQFAYMGLLAYISSFVIYRILS